MRNFIVDERGQVVAEVTRQGLRGMGAGTMFTPSGSIGVDIWEWLHPEQVQQEYRIVDQEPPSIETIKEGAFNDAITQARQNVSTGIDTAITGAAQAGKWAVIGIVALGFVMLMDHLPKAR